MNTILQPVFSRRDRLGGTGLATVLAALVVCPSPVAASEVALIIDRLGGVECRADGAVVRCEILDRLAHGTQVELQDNARFAIAHYSERRKYLFEKAQRFTVTEDGLEMLEGPDPEARPLGRVMGGRIRLDDLSGQGQTRGRASLVDRAWTSAVLTDSPSLHWPRDDRAGGYRFLLFDGGGELLHDVLVREPGFRLSDSLRLREKSVYTWQVIATGDARGRQLAKGQIWLLEPALRAELAAIAPAENASVDDLVLYALALEFHKARQAALVVWQRITQARPALAQTGTSLRPARQKQ